MPPDAPKRTLVERLGLDAVAAVRFVEVPPALIGLLQPVQTTAAPGRASSNGIVWAVGNSAAIASHASDVAAAYARGDRLWMLYPKRSGRIRTDISRDNGWKPMLSLGFVPVSQVAVALPHSRAQESSADEIGLVLMARAGYDPAAAVGFWERFAAHNRSSGGQTPWFLRTHPLDQQRIARIQQLLPKAKAEFRPPAP